MNLSRVNNFLFQVGCRSQTIFSNKCFYGRWMHREPAKIKLPYEGSSLKKETVIDLESQTTQKSDEKNNAVNLKDKNNISNDIVRIVHKNKNSLETNKKLEEKRQRFISKEKYNIRKQNVFDENNEIIFEKLKDNDGRIR